MSLTTEKTAPTAKTRFLVLSDTHGLDTLPEIVSHQYADVVLHCGDLTTESKIEEFKASIRLIQALNAPLKLIIAGNHDFTMDIPMFQKKVAEAQPLEPELVQQVYGSHGEARKLFDEQQDKGIVFVDEGFHSFHLSNGARLNIYASPFTPSLGDWGFQYHPDRGHDFRIANADIVMTHGPPRGILDYTHSGNRAGCSHLFEAIARSQPRPLMHCFGHIHEGWGAKLVKWRDQVSDKPSHLTDIDNGNSCLISTLTAIKGRGKVASLYSTSHCSGDPRPMQRNAETLFVNASMQGSEDLPIQPSWLVDLELPAAF
ncbi:hypothetical protein N7452_003833 [Penicillium brevicompactum]|uniref:Calcineurin-like phosphoesterase domain-containing protein n=1 Tax=Penicillium brevicompactum TaxID=5074 RepID=A0A9W9QUL2_PENBR|nr:hypothetical protein N7452_003833 [Penicillium brevicompactum]